MRTVSPMGTVRLIPIALTEPFPLNFYSMERNNSENEFSRVFSRISIVWVLTITALFSVLLTNKGQAQNPAVGEPVGAVPTPPKPIPPRLLKINLNDAGTHYFQFTFNNQTWLQYNNNNPGSTVVGDPRNNSFDIGLRRTRIQAYGQLTDRVFFYTQFGQNNFNHLSQRKTGNLFFHDVIGEYAVARKALSFGAGLSAWSGLARYASPSVGTILTMDAPLVEQATNDVNDLFLRKLSVYAKGKLGKLDYRVALSDPFVLQTAATVPGAPGANSNFSLKAPRKQVQGYFMYQFLDQESNLTPYMTGSYLGAKRVFNIGAGFIIQPETMSRLSLTDSSTIYSTMNLFGVDLFYDTPLNKEKGTALTLYAAYLNYDFGKNYIRMSGPLNPANGVVGNPSFNGAGDNTPLYGTGSTVLIQAGYLMAKNLFGPDNGTLQPYAQVQYSDYERLADPMVLYDIGVNWLIKGHNSKVSLNYQNRPVYAPVATAAETPSVMTRRGQVVLQYQIYFQ